MTEPIVLDVREDLKQGKEPFHKIMAAVDTLGPQQELVIVCAFEPRPLYKVLASKGFAYRSEENEDGDWRITFYRNGTQIASAQ